MKAWSNALRSLLEMALRYVAVCLPLFVIWEVAQLPLYTLWTERDASEIAYSVLHCTFGDALIAFFTIDTALLAALWFSRWRTPGLIAFATVLLGLMTTAAIEWTSVAKGRWSYSELMPVDPWLGIGLSPILQWLLIPALALLLLRERLRQWIAGLGEA